MRKLVKYFTLVCLMIFCFSITVYANETDNQETSTSETSTDDTSTTEPSNDEASSTETSDAENSNAGDTSDNNTGVIDNGLQIDNDKLYEGMQKTYKDGYIPTTENGTINLILPLMGDTLDNKVTISVDLGSSSNSPFVYGNYSQTISSEDIYLFEFLIPLQKNPINGTYPINLITEYISLNGNKTNQTFTVYVTITSGVNPVDPNATPEKEAAERPDLFISSCDITPNEVGGEEEFTMTVTFENIGNLVARKIKLSYGDTTSQDIVSVDTSNVIQVDNIGVGETATATFTLKTTDSIIEGRYSIPVSVTYSDYYGGSYSFIQDFSISVKREAIIDFDKLELPEKVPSGETVSLPVNVFNIGKSNLKNVKLSLTCDGLNAISSVFLGDISSGQTGNAELKIFVGTTSSSDGLGFVNGEYKISYEDENGEIQEIIETIETEIIAPVEKDDSTEEDTEEAGIKQPDFQWWVAILVGFAVTAIIISVIILNKVLRINKINFKR